MKTVRAVVAMSGGVATQPIAEYVGLVKEVGMALRELVGRVGTIKEGLPVSAHEEVCLRVHLCCDVCCCEVCCCEVCC